eukprot:COSAG02_NODE_4108_length_5768_cov_66.257717_4_plen_544_part_00
MFIVRTRSRAKAEFESWRARQGGLTFDASAIKTRAIKPVYLPFFAFSGSLSATFTGSLGYTKRVNYTDSNGNQRTRRRTDWYTKMNMQVGPRNVDPTVEVAMLQYAGFFYRREFVHRAITLGCTRQLDTARSLHAGMLPESVGVHEFEAKPSFAYAAAASSFGTIASTMARDKLQDPALDEQFSGPLWGTACPATDWTQPDRYEVESVHPTFSGAQLFPPAGVVLVPFWICEYDLHGKNYRAFINGVTGKTVGATHVDQGKAQLASAACATCLSLVCGYLIAQESANELLAEAVALAGPVFGWVGGGIYSQRSVTQWNDTGEKRAVLRRQNEACAKDPYWQSELRKFASVWESQEEARRANALTEPRLRTRRRECAAAEAQGEQQVAAETVPEVPHQSDKGVDVRTQLGEPPLHEASASKDGPVAAHASSSWPEVEVKEYEWSGMDDYAILDLDRKDFEGSGLSQTVIAQRMRKAEIEAAHRAQCLVWQPRHNEHADPAECVARLERIGQAKENLVGDAVARDARREKRDKRKASRDATDDRY